MRGWRLEKR
jgi:hypothetical protein